MHQEHSNKNLKISPQLSSDSDNTNPFGRNDTPAPHNFNEHAERIRSATMDDTMQFEKRQMTTEQAIIENIRERGNSQAHFGPSEE